MRSHFDHQPGYVIAIFGNLGIWFDGKRIRLAVLGTGGQPGATSP